MARITHIIKVLKEGRNSEAVLALFLILAVDLVCRAGFYLHDQAQNTVAFDAPYRSKAWWLTKDFMKQEKPADVILLGASDINTALYTAEATHFKTPQNQLLKHNSDYLEEKLKELNGPYKSTFFLSLGGEMPSDSFLFVKTLVKEGKMPKALFLAVTPRSFYDATFGDPSRTAIFKMMAKLGGTKDFEFACRGSLLDTADYLSLQAIALYGHKWEITSWQQCVAQEALSKLLHENFETINTPESIRKIAELDLPEDYGQNEQMTPPYDEKHPIFINNLDHYRDYYKKVKRGMLPLQVAFYQQLCEFCENHGIKLVVCNSPVTAENRALIPDDIRSKYLTMVAATARKYGGTFIDMDQPNAFAHSDFYDSVHLNGIGGQKYFDQVGVILSRAGGVSIAGKTSAN